MQQQIKIFFLGWVFLLPVPLCYAATDADANAEANTKAKEINTEATAVKPIKHKDVKWSFELKGGMFKPAVDNWELFYGDDKTIHLSTAIAYKVIRQVEFGIEAGWIDDSGKGYLPANDITGGQVDITLYPVNIFVLYRAVYSSQQIVVPYIGGGWSRIYYKQKIENQSNIDGAEDGIHYRAGVQFLLNNVSKKSTHNMKTYGVKNTYFFLELQEIDVKVNSTNTDLGGTSLLAGFLMEFF